jgi:hypothetical protein
VKKIISALLFLSLFNTTKAQQVYERNNLEVHQFLATMSQKGYIEWNDLIYPITKEKIQKALIKLQHVNALNHLEQLELDFYLKEYNRERKKLYHKTDSNFSIHLDPIITANIVSGSIKNYNERSVGVSAWGSIGKKFGYQFSFHDINQNGSQFDTVINSIFQEANRGIVTLNDPNVKRQVNFTDLRASLMYAFKNGTISIGQDALTWGYGENGQLVLSNKAPYYPYIRLDYQPFNWFTFNYTHAFLQSEIIDSANIYPIPSRVFPASREVFIKKYMASHSIDIRLKKGLHLSFGESIIYNDQLQLGYLLPIMFFKGYDNMINKGIIQAGSNGQFFGQLNTKNLILKKSQFYATLFIDEIRLASILNPEKSRNQVGFNFGVVKQDFLVPNLIAGFEYTRLNPFLYRNFLPAQNYTSNRYVLGDWIGQNSDKLLVFLKYSPLPRLKTYLRYQKLRNGPEGSMNDQYFGKPQMRFMNYVQMEQNSLFFKASYEYKNRLLLNFSFNDYGLANKQYSIGLSYGL